MCGQNDVPLRMCFRILSNGFQKSRSAVQQSNCKLAAQQTTFNNQCIIEQRTKTTFNNQGVGGRRRPGEAAPRALLGGYLPGERRRGRRPGAECLLAPGCGRPAGGRARRELNPRTTARPRGGGKARAAER